MERPLTKNIRSGKEPLTLKDYEKAGGYRGVRKALLTMAPQEVTKLVKDANLRGRGGAGFPTGMKWSHRRPSSWLSMQMKWNRAPSRTVFSLRAIPISS